MCILVDTCVLPAVFSPSAANHAQFKPVHDWIFKGKGKLVYGGSKFKEDLPQKYNGIIIELRKQNRVFEAPCKVVDKLAKEVSSQAGKDCDDQHIIAIIISSGCRLLCTADTRSHKHIKNSALYPKAKMVPKIYNGTAPRKQSKLLKGNHIAPCCKK